MTFVVELRDLKKYLPRPVSHFRPRLAEGLCEWRTRLALAGLLGLALDGSVDPGVVPSSGVLGLLCGVLTAVVSATLGLLRDASSGVVALLGDDTNPLLQIGQKASLCFGEPLFPFDICPETGPFPAFSGRYACALVGCALFLFGCGFSRKEPAMPGKGR